MTVDRAGGEGRPRSESGPVVTIDGPAGSGKSTTAREVARRLGFRHLDSGALYRAIAYAVLRTGSSSADWSELTEESLRRVPIRLEAAPEGFALFLGLRRLDEELRTPEVTGSVSRIAPLPAVRGRLLALQREAATLGGLVADGRDMGSVVFPDAEVKVYLVADLEERARRRLLEQRGVDPAALDAEQRSRLNSTALTPHEVQEERRRLDERDTRDSARTLAPLRRPDDAILLDTTGMAFEEQVEAVLARVREALES